VPRRLSGSAWNVHRAVPPVAQCGPMKYAVCFSLLFAACSAHANTLVSHPNEVGPRNFTRAKQVLPRVYDGREKDFYCACPYQGKKMDLQACGVTPRKQVERAERLEWEHVVAAWTIGHQRQCWQTKIDGKLGGRRHCARTDPEFVRAEGDLVNLVPAVGEINGDRSNYGFSVWTQKPEPMYGQCQTVVDFKLRAIQPRPAVRGEIARIHFYMADTYQLRLSRQDVRLFCAWAKQFPVSDWERLRDERITAMQGYGNPYVQQPAVMARRCPS